MSAQAISIVWDLQVSPEEKLLLLWIANNTGEIGYPVMIDPYNMGRFIGGDHHRAMEVLAALAQRGCIVWGNEEDETSSYVWLWNEAGVYQSPVNWLGESRGRNQRVTALIERDGPGCAYCDKTPINYHVDHFIPKALNGPDQMDNLVLACPTCNLAKRALHPSVFLSADPERYELIRTNLKYLHA